jgi:glycogen debranching enzyme
MWDAQDGFFYNLARDSGAFATRDGISLKRKEIIGFLPMWAGIATKEQAARLVQQLTNPESFWRRYGVPTLAADDPYYNGNVTKCCQWNGAVWLLWDYMVFRGLLNYGYRKEAEELVRRVMDGVIFQLKDNHRFWESFSPDNTQLASPKNYLWDTIIARMMIDLYGPGAKK